MREEANTRTAFVSYSREDEEWLKSLRTALTPVLLDHGLDLFVDTRIEPSEEWRVRIESALRNSPIAILLLSQDFLASPFIREIELPILLRRWSDGELAIFVVVASAYEESAQPELNEIQFVNAKNKPLDSLMRHQQKQVWVELATAIRKQLQAPTIPAGNVGSPISLPLKQGEGRGGGSRQPHQARVILLPHRRNPYFSGREEDLKRLHDSLQRGGKAGIVEAIKGLGGVGKTQLALEYAYRHEDDYVHILWAAADTKETLDRDYSAIAKTLNLSTGQGTMDEVRQAALEWLERTPDYLFILDNADEPKTAESYLPIRIAGKVLITSRASNLIPLGVSKPQDLASWTEDEGADFLLSRTESSADHRDEAKQLTAKLGGLPLALEQAAAYMSETGTGITNYSKAYDRQGIELLERSGPEYGPERTVAITWSLNIKEVERVSPASLDLLRIAALLSPDRIPFEIFEQGAEYLPECLRNILSNDPGQLAMGELLTALNRYSLVKVNREVRTFDLHRLVQEVAAGELSSERRASYVNDVLHAISRAFPNVKDFRNWPKIERLLPHALRIVQQAAENMTTAYLLNDCAYFLDDRADYSTGRALYERALGMCERIQGSDHLDTAQFLNNLAYLLRAQGDFVSARPLYERALAIRERVLGPDCLDTATSLNNLSLVLRDLGDLTSAESLNERALAIRERLLGPNHPKTAASLSDLADLRRAQGDFDSALSLYERALNIRESVLGPDHPKTAASLTNLADLRRSKGDLASAFPLYEHALTLWERALPAFHPSVTTARRNLAALYRDLGRTAEADDLERQADEGEAEFKRRNP